MVWTRPEGAAPPDIKPEKLRAIIEVIDDVPKLPRVSLDFADWVANYTLSSPGMVLRMMMSAGRAFSPPAPRYGVRLVGAPPSRMTPARARVIEAASNGMIWVKSSLAEAAGVSTGVIDGLVDSGTLIAEPLPDWHALPLDIGRERAKLTPEQQEAARELLANTGDGFTVTLLDGVTGSGKTEVYFEAIAQALARGQQALVLMPEIALTSQFIARCEERFGAKPAEWHSGVPAPQRGRVWRAVAENKAKLVVGARSALFLPFPDLGLIVVDEEHDAGYKQEERVTYQARDMAVVRGRPRQVSRRAQLGDAVDREPGQCRAGALPACKARHPLQGRRTAGHRCDRHACLATRARQMALTGAYRGGGRDLGARRASSPVLEPPRLCAGHALPEMRLQIRMPELLGLARRAQIPPPARMPPLRQVHPHSREVPELPGREFARRVRARHRAHRRGGRRAFSRCAPRAACRAISHRTSPSSATPCARSRSARSISSSAPSSWPRAITSRASLWSAWSTAISVLAQADPRAAERTFQLLTQVTGRAGREAIKGRGLIQTYMPEHPVVAALVSGDRDTFLAREIEERRKATMPPFGRLAALLVSASSREAAESYAREVARAAPAAAKIEVLGPAEAPLAVIRGRYRFRLLVKATREADLQAYLRLWLSSVPKAKGDVRLNVDIDPYSFL